MIIYANDSGIIDYPDTSLHDPNSQVFYSLIYRPSSRRSSAAYIQETDVIVPDQENGCMYECVSGGISASVAPTFLTLENKTFDDGSVKWRTIPYSAKLGYNDVITLSSWTASDGVTIGSDIIFGGNMTMVKVLSVLPSLKTFTITNTITIARSSGFTEQFDKTLRIKVAQL